MRAALKRSIILVVVMMAAVVVGNVEANDDLNDIVEVRTSDNSTSNEANMMIDRLENIDDSILYEANRSGTKIILMDVPLTQLPEFKHLSGITPRGWESSGNTWDDVPGAGGYVTAARIGYSEPGNGHSTINLELHEFGHAIDSYVAGFTISDSEEFRNIMDQEKDDLFSDHEVPEYFDVPSEYFAEVFGMYYLGGSARDELQSRAPQTYEFISSFHNRLISFSDVTGNTMTITWDDMEEASAYAVYQNGEKVDEVEAGEEEYTAEDLDPSTNYEFYIEALDDNEDTLYTSYYRFASTNAEEDPEEIDTSELEETLEEANTRSNEIEDVDLNASIEEAESVLEEAESGDVSQADINDARDTLFSALENIEEDSEESGNTEEERPGSDEAQVSRDVEQEEENNETSEEETESPGAESEDAEESATESDEIQGEDNRTIWIITAIILIVLALISSIILIKKRK